MAKSCTVELGNLSLDRVKYIPSERLYFWDSSSWTRIVHNVLNV